MLDRFPPKLKTLVEAKLAAGNGILKAGAGHPAPPAGDMIILAKDISTRSVDAQDGLRAQLFDPPYGGVR